MFDTLLLSRETPVVPVEDDPEVARLREAHSKAVKDLSVLKAEYGKLWVIAEQPEGAPPALPEEILDAKAAIKDVEVRTQRAAAQVSRLDKQLTGARARATRTFDDARHDLRRPLIKTVFEKFREAVEANEALVAFDRETRELGGSETHNPTPGLLRDAYDFQEALARKDGLL